MPTRFTNRLTAAGTWADAVPDPDAALLRRYAADRDGSAFAVLVRRHGPLVFGVCLRTAGHRQDAEDAFQATFLILARRAGEVARPELLGNWLYGVAYRVARKAKRAATRRRHREAAVAEIHPPVPDAGWSDTAPVIDEELARLADHHRSAVLLCDVQGLSRRDAAARLGIAEGTLSSRLNAARKKLAARLTKRGVTLSVAGLSVMLAGRTTAAVPDELVRRLEQLLLLVSNPSAIGGPVGELLREGVAVRTKLWVGVTVLGLAASGVAVAAWPGDDKPKAAGPVAKKADVPKAEVKPDGDKPKKAAKPKLLDTVSVDGMLTSPFWGHDGKSVYVALRNPSNVFPPSAARTYVLRGYSFDPKRVAASTRQFEFDCQTGGLLGFYNDGRSFAVYSAAGRRINAPDMILNYDIGAHPFDLNGLRPVTANADHPRVEIDLDDGRPVAISPDGKTVFAEKVKQIKAAVGDQQHLWLAVTALYAKTGELVRTVGTFGDADTAARGYKLSPAADRLYVYLHTADEAVIRCVEVATGKTVWDAKFSAPRPTQDQTVRPSSAVFQTLSNQLITVSRDGKRVAVLVAGDAEQKSIRPKVLDAQTGKIAVGLDSLSDGVNQALDFSHDGRLLVGKTAPLVTDDEMRRMAMERAGYQPGRLPGGVKGEQLVVWDLKTGEVLRTWDDNLNVQVAFAPDRPVLAIVETERETTGRVPAANQPAAGGSATVPTYQYKSTIGFWDLSPLLK